MTKTENENWIHKRKQRIEQLEDTDIMSYEDMLDISAYYDAGEIF